MLIRWVIILGLSCLVSSYGEAASNKCFEAPVTLNVEDQSLKAVLKQLAHLSGQQIILDSPNQNHRVSVTLVEVPFEEALASILKGLNHTVIWNCIIIIENVSLKQNGPKNQKNSAESLGGSGMKFGQMSRTADY